jgi:hypothetical protein
LEGLQAYHDQGHGFVECTRRFGFTRSAWNKAIGRGALNVRRSLSDDRRRRHNWAEVQSYYDAGASMRECRARFGFCNVAWAKAAQRGEIRPRLFGEINCRRPEIRIIAVVQEGKATERGIFGGSIFAMRHQRVAR